MTPKTLGRYEVLGELGKGAMGVVYLARDPLIQRRLALKTFRIAYAAQDAELEQFRARFLREAQSAGILNHPNIVTIHDVVEDTEAGVYFIAMEYVQGTDLKRLMQRRERLPIGFVLDVVAQIAEGLDYAHAQGVVHRDVKPANIIITSEKHAKITDFGIARVHASNLTVEGQLLGTPNYMAPEQIQGRDVDHRADLFSLGVMLYELLTGAKPFAGENLTMVTHRIVHEAFKPPTELVGGLPPGVAEVLDRALRKNPDERYGSAGDMASRIRVLLEPTRPGVAATSFLDPPSGQHAAPSSGAHPAPDLTAAATPPSSPGERPPSDSTSFTVATPLPPDSGTIAYPPDSTVAGSRAEGPVPITGIESGSVLNLPSGVSAGTVENVPPVPRRGPSIPRLLAIGLLTAAVAVVAGVFGIWSLRGEGPTTVAVDPRADLQRRWLPLYTEGLSLLEAGDPASAIERFERAMAIVPENRKIRQARLRADEMLVVLDGEDPETAIARRLESATKALKRRRYAEAVDLADEILTLEPRHAEAASLRAEAQEGLDRRGQTLDRFRNPTSRNRDTTRPVAPPPPAAPAARATLAIAFVSEISEGMLTVYAGQEQIYRESFDFTQRGMLGRRAGTGELEASRNVPAGASRLKIYLWRQGEATEVAETSGTLAPGATHTLRLRATADGNLLARLE